MTTAGVVEDIRRETGDGYMQLVRMDERITLKETRMGEVEFTFDPVLRNGEGLALMAHFGDGEWVDVGESLEQFAEAYEIPYGPLKTFSGPTQARMFQDRAQYGDMKDQVFRWGIDREEKKLLYCGPANKPYIPFSYVGDLLAEKGFSGLKGGFARHGNGRIIALHPRAGMIEPRLNDIVAAGVFVEMNPLMNRNPILLPWSERLTCLNGMTTTEWDGESVKERILVLNRSAAEVLEQFDKIADRMFDQAMLLNHQFGSLIEDVVGSLEEGIRTLARARRVPRTLEKRIIEVAKEEDRRWQIERVGPRTWYDVINIFTREIQRVPNDDSRLSLQGRAGAFTSDQHARCEKCGTELN